MKTKSNYYIGRDLFLRLLGFVYLIAFWSLWSQVSGLYGKDGILPISELMQAVQKNLGGAGFFQLPTVFWLSSSDTMLLFVCVIGVLSSIGLMIGLLPSVNLFILWLFYLSFLTTGRTFLSFQWDILLVEVGFIAIFLSPLCLWLHRSKAPPSKLMILLLNLVLFKLMFMSGVVKLNSGDPTWKNLTAMTVHYYTQPIPNPLSWYVHHMPVWFHKISCGFMFFTELFVPFLIFTPRWGRLTAGLLLIGMQFILIFTGNYTYFNYLAIVLCLVLIEDRFYLKLLKFPYFEKISKTQQDIQRKWRRVSTGVLRWGLVIVLGTMCSFHLLGLYRKNNLLPAFVLNGIKTVRPFALSSGYGLFANMTEKRYEIIIEGSLDRKTWKVYEFPFKPGDLNRIPPQVAPHQPRVDWQMWFAALRPDIRHVPWLQRFLGKILQNSNQVKTFFSNDPFAGRAPRFIRAKLYDYQFTTPEEKKETGQWWKRTYIREYSPVLTLKPGG